MAQGLRALGVALLLAGCGQAGPETASQTDRTAPGIGNVAYGAPLLASDLLIREVTPQLDFSATLAPEMALAPVLATEILGTARQYQDKMQADATQAEAGAQAGGFTFRPYGVMQRWTTEAETPALLAFSGLVWEYTGGAHGNSNFTVALFDRSKERRITTNDLFVDPTAAMSVLQPLWCKGLVAARKEKLGADGATPFGDCPSLADLPIVPTGNGSIAQLKVLAAPYVAGSYAEGSYEVLLETAAILPLLKPEWRATFGGAPADAG